MGPAYASPASPNLYERAEREGNFKTFLAAVKAADMAEALKGDEVWTVFVPTDDAFAGLPAGTVDRLLKPENKAELTALLKNHLIPGSIFASTWANEKVPVKTKAGNELMVDGTGSPFLVGDAQVIRMNIPAENGTIPAIDGVLLQPS
ncbi:MAG TPA: fasciclin domain-containing protein [Methyloceanibacter sp.]|nr:fasciclin domain-containing protein [Methyloceanibacter sp.]